MGQNTRKVDKNNTDIAIIDFVSSSSVSTKMMKKSTNTVTEKRPELLVEEVTDKNQANGASKLEKYENQTKDFVE